MIATVASWLGYWSGVSSEAGKGYAFWSGIGSCLGYVVVFGVAYKHVRCQSCWRVALHHKVPGTHYRTCPHHSTADEHERLLAKHKRKWPNHVTHS